MLDSPLKYGLRGRSTHRADVFTAPVLGTTAVMLTSRDAIVEALQDDGFSVAFNSTDAWKRLVADPAANAIMADGALRQQQRKMLSMAFTSEALDV